MMTGAGERNSCAEGSLPELPYPSVLPGQEQRITSIDLVRGIVMVLMVLDHVRDFVCYGTWYLNPADLSVTTPALFATRWITHFCAPTFVFLAGTSAFLYGRKVSRGALSGFLVSRGLWLVLLELTFINFLWTFDYRLHLQFFQVIWAIGASMICLSILIWLPRGVLLGFGLVMVFGHHAFDGLDYAQGEAAYLPWAFLHAQRFYWDPPWLILVAYPLVPWIGVMAVGYVFGQIFTRPLQRRRPLLLVLGITTVALFLILRLANVYGDPSQWTRQPSSLFTVMSFFNTTKYPPSLQFLAMTLGPAILFLAACERFRGKLARVFITFGRVPFFFYITHIAFAHALGIAGLVYAGIDWREFVFTPERFFSMELEDHGFSLPVVYAAWAFTVLVLYLPCRWFEGVKKKYHGRWWVSYL